MTPKYRDEKSIYAKLISMEVRTSTLDLDAKVKSINLKGFGLETRNQFPDCSIQELIIQRERSEKTHMSYILHIIIIIIKKKLKKNWHHSWHFSSSKPCENLAYNFSLAFQNPNFFSKITKLNLVEISSLFYKLETLAVITPLTSLHTTLP